MAKVAVLPCVSITDTLVAALKDDGTGSGQVGMLGGLDAVLEKLAPLLAMYAFSDSVLVPFRTIDDTQASLCELFVANLGDAGKVLALEEVPPSLLCSAWTEVEVLACADWVESVLNTKLLNVALTLLITVHAGCAVLAVLVVFDGTNVAHSEASLGVDSIEHLVESGFTCKSVWTSRHDRECNVDSLQAESIVRLW